MNIFSFFYFFRYPSDTFIFLFIYQKYIYHFLRFFISVWLTFLHFFIFSFFFFIFFFQGHHTESNYETTLSLSVPIPIPSERQTLKHSSVTLSDCFRLHCQKEILLNSDKWECAKCHVRVCAEKKISISKIPNILIIHLKRFQMIETTGTSSRNYICLDVLMFSILFFLFCLHK